MVLSVLSPWSPIKPEIKAARVINLHIHLYPLFNCTPFVH